MHEGTYTMNSGRQQQVHQIIQIATPSASQKIFPNSLGVGLDFFKKKSLITGVSLDNFFLNEGGSIAKDIRLVIIVLFNYSLRECPSTRRSLFIDFHCYGNHQP